MTSLDEGGLPAQQREYLDWLLTPEPERAGADRCSQNEWARLRGLAPSTLHRWKKNPSFVKEWERRYVEQQIQPDRVAAILDSMYLAATEKADVQAAKEWLRWMDRMSPQKPVDRSAEAEVSKLTNKALLAELAELMESLGDEDGPTDQ